MQGDAQASGLDTTATGGWLGRGVFNPAFKRRRICLNEEALGDPGQVRAGEGESGCHCGFEGLIPRSRYRGTPFIRSDSSLEVPLRRLRDPVPKSRRRSRYLLQSGRL